ncbi:NAD(P)H-dependent oxidoreductase [Alterisphingorhabdus coralli]|uniref:Flavodoxin family protein n=1 Tax=Alterisphingorhabdus coralli TaxID=3071408 RepID=A0AA97F7A0_9SPHN|nr:NAD(P)H-dependent oxidoreductase [Parasphingorhabdus sp. SCSIO 66989]WOE74557.1 flavodoxin family protein [Parasphingorhabdus sp. SCSIO 66989]
MQRTLAIIWFSRTGAAKALAEAAYQGALSAGGVLTHLVEASDANVDLMLETDGYIFACPENLAAIAGGMKEFFDSHYYPLLGRIEGRPYAAIIAAGSDGENARKQLERIATGWRLKRVMDSMIVNTQAQTAEEILAPKTIPQAQRDAAEDMGAALANGLEMGVF